MLAAKRENGGNQANHRDRHVGSSRLGSYCLSESWGQDLQAWKGRREVSTAPPAKSRHTNPIAYLERVTIRFAVLCVHVAEAAMPTQGGPFTAAGEAF